MNNDTLIHLLLSFYDKRDDVKPCTRGQLASIRTLLRQQGLSLLVFDEDPVQAFAILSRSRFRTIPSEEEIRHLLRQERKEKILANLKTWARKGVEVLGPTETAYPLLLLLRMNVRSPLLFCQGNLSLLNQGGVAVVGSRALSEECKDYARKIGKIIAKSGLCLISGGALGADAESMRGALSSQGFVVSALASLSGKTEPVPEGQKALDQGTHFVKLSMYPPGSSTERWMLMERNALIYGMSEVALVVESDVGKGGTWGGVHQQLRENKKDAYFAVPVFCRDQGSSSQGLSALLGLGAEPWPEFEDPELLKAFVASDAKSEPTYAASETMLWAAEASPEYRSTKEEEDIGENE